jgi:hypothetical protein
MASNQLNTDLVEPSMSKRNAAATSASKILDHGHSPGDKHSSKDTVSVFSIKINLVEWTQRAEEKLDS